MTGIYFSGLICIGDSLNMNIIQHLDKNSLVFKLHGHYFVGVESLKVKVPMLRFLEMPRKLSFTGENILTSLFLTNIIHRNQTDFHRIYYALKLIINKNHFFTNNGVFFLFTHFLNLWSEVCMFLS